MIILDTAGDTLQAEASAASSLTLSAYGMKEVSNVQSYIKLGQDELAGGGTKNTIYTVPASTVTICSVIVVVNTSSATVTLDLWHVPNGGSADDTNILFSGLSLTAGAVLVWNKGEISVQKGLTGTVKYLPFYFEGMAVDEEVIDGHYFENASTVVKVILTAREAPTGAALTIDLLKDGAEQSVISTLADGGTYQTTNITDTAYTTAERFGLKIKTIGSTSPGKGIGAIVFWRET